MQSSENENICALETVHDHTSATKAEVEDIVTQRLVAFHRALVERGQIIPIPINPEDRVPIQS